MDYFPSIGCISNIRDEFVIFTNLTRMCIRLPFLGKVLIKVPRLATCVGLLRKLPLLPSPGHVAVPLGHVWDVLLPADGYNRKLSGYDAYVTWRSPEVV